MKLSPRKRKRCSKDVDVERDRLSEMPDEVIVHILSFLPIIDAVRTILLRRFGNLWTLLPTLNCGIYEVLSKMVPNSEQPSNDLPRFNIFLRNFVALHKRPVIDKFRLHLGGDYWIESSDAGDCLTMCFKFALDKQAKKFTFSDNFRHFPKNFPIPNLISQSLVKLKLRLCHIEPQVQVSLGSLKKLSLEKVILCEVAFQQFISGCPSLQELSVKDPYPLNKLYFASPNISTLSLRLTDESDVFDHWTLDSPNLKTLDLDTNWIPHVIDVSSVRNMYLKYIEYDSKDQNDCRMFNIFFEKFQGAQVFQMSDRASEKFLHGLDLIDNLHLFQIRWKCLVLEWRVSCKRCHLLGIYQLMRSSKHLEELIMYTIEDITFSSAFNTSSLCIHQNTEARFDMPPIEFSSDCVIPKFKTVTLHGYFKTWNRQLQLVEFLLKTATVLDKLVIVFTDQLLTRDEELEFVKHVSSFQRASASARVLFA